MHEKLNSEVLGHIFPLLNDVGMSRIFNQAIMPYVLSMRGT